MQTEKPRISDDIRMTSMWGTFILDDGFTQVPNMLIRNYRQLGIEHGEFGFLMTLLTYRHDERDPFPGQKTLAQHLNCSERQIQKWINSLRRKRLLRTGRRVLRNGMYAGNVYSIKWLIDRCMDLVGADRLPDTQVDDVIWDDEEPLNNGPEPEVRVQNFGAELEVQIEPELEVQIEDEPEVRVSNKKKVKTQNENPHSTYKRLIAPSNRFEQWLKTKEMQLSDELISAAFAVYDDLSQKGVRDVELMFALGRVIDAGTPQDPEEFRYSVLQNLRRQA